jgi:hypothetical protein
MSFDDDVNDEEFVPGRPEEGDDEASKPDTEEKDTEEWS